MSEIIVYICSSLECGTEWEDDGGENLCPVCGATGKIKPPAPPGGIKAPH